MKTKEIEETKQHALDAIFYLDVKEGSVLAKELEFQLNKLSEQPGADKKEIENISGVLVRLKLLIFHRLKDEEANRLIKNNAVKLINDPDLDLIDRIEARQLTVAESLRYEFVNQPLIEAIHQNEETIGKERIFVSGNPEAQVPTVANWLLDYDRTYGTEPQSDLVWLEYVNSGANASRLETKDKEVLRKLLKFYEFLKPEYSAE